MPGENDLSGKVGLDTTAFKAGVTALSNQIKDIETSFRASATVMGDWSSTTAGLQTRVDSLSEKLKLQKDKLKGLTDEFKLLSGAEGDHSKDLASYAAQMNTLERQIKGTESDLKKYGAQLKDVDSKSKGITFEKFNSGLASTSAAASKALKGIGVFAAGATAALGKMLESSVSNADELQKLSDVTGLTAEQLQVMKYQGSALGVELDTMTGAQAKLTKSMSAAQGGTGTQAKAFQALGVSIKDSSGHLRNSNDVFNDAITKLGGVQNSTERDALAMQIFGKSAMQLNPLIKAGGDQLKQMSNEAKKNGAIMSNDAVSGLDNFGDSVDAIKLSISGLIGSAFGKLTPQLNGLTEKVKNLDLSKLTAGISFALDHLPQIGAAIAGVTGAVVAWKLATMAANAINLAANGIESIKLAQQVLSTGNTLAQAAATEISTGAQIGLSTAIIAQIGSWIAQKAALAASAVATNATAAAQWLLNAALNANPIGIVITLIAALAAALVVLFNKNKAFHDWVINAFAAIKNGAQALVTSVVVFFTQTIPNAFNSAKANMLNIWASAIIGITSAWNTFKTYLSNPELIFQAVQSAFSAAIGWITSLPSEALQWGKDIIMGIVDGIKSAASAVGDAVKGVAKDIRKFLHFSVPDEGPLVDFPTWMPDMMSGLAQGIESNKYKVIAAVRSLAADMSLSPTVRASYVEGYSAPSAAPIPAGATYNLTQIINSPKATSPAENARQARNMLRQASLSSRR